MNVVLYVIIVHIKMSAEKFLQILKVMYLLFNLYNLMNYLLHLSPVKSMRRPTIYLFTYFSIFLEFSRKVWSTYLILMLPLIKSRDIVFNCLSSLTFSPKSYSIVLH